MQIGELAARCGCPVETIRYYEKVGLLPAPRRAENGYRQYGDNHRKWLQFTLRSRALGFTQRQVKRLAAIASQPQPPCEEICELLADHVIEVRAKIRELEQMERALLRLKAKCKDATFQECPAVDELMT
ncbi:MAG TPA: MerR family DNA-binding transcriptional regulator [Woeseiaceae bacterium]|nr:MerR family DNA-binding transcriptional regulator [Woeseiaceae bacterium]